MLFDGKEHGPYVGIAGAKLSTPKRFVVVVALCCFRRFQFCILMIIFTLRSFTTSTLTPWRSKQQLLLFMCWTSMIPHCRQSFVEEIQYQHYARQPSDKTQQSSSRSQHTAKARIGTDSHSSNDSTSEPNSWTTLPRSSSSSFRSLWTVNKTDLHTGIFQISQRRSTDHFLTYKFSPTNFWRPVHKNTTTSEPASWTSWPMHPPKMKTNYYSFALRELRHRYPQTERSPITTLIEWLWHQHQESLRRQRIDLGAVQAFFHIT